MSKVPSSVVTAVAPWTVHSSRAAVRTKTDAGPVATAHGLGALTALHLASAMLPSSIGRGSHFSQMAVAHVPMGMRWAPYAGSTIPVAEPSATIRARSMSWPEHPETGACMVAQVLRCWSKVEGGTPVMAAS